MFYEGLGSPLAPVDIKHLDNDRNGNFVSVENYLVRMSITITVRDLTLVGTLLDQSVTLGADYVSSVTFTVADPNPYIREARQLAIFDAKSKAEAYARGSDSSITGLFSVLVEGDDHMNRRGEAPLAVLFHRLPLVVEIERERRRVALALRERRLAADVRGATYIRPRREVNQK